MEKQIAQCDQTITRLIAADAVLAHKAKRLNAIPGGGPVVAATVLAEMPELGRSPNKPPPPWRAWLPTIVTAAARKACANISGGRRPVRCALYLAILHGHENARRFSHRLFSPLQRPHLFNWPFELSAGRVEAG